MALELVRANSEYFVAANESNFDFDRTDPFSIVGWVCPSSINPGSIDSLFLKDSHTSPFPGYALWFYDRTAADGDGLELALINNNTTNRIFIHVPNYGLSVGVWTHFGMTYDGSSLASGVTMYKDGQSQSTTTTADNLSASMLNNVAPSVGIRSGDGFGPLDAKLADLRVYDVELSAEDMAHINRSRGADRMVDNLVARWLMAEQPDGIAASGASSIIDIAGQANHGTPTNTPTYRVAPLRLLNPRAFLLDLPSNDVSGILAGVGGLTGASKAMREVSGTLPGIGGLVGAATKAAECSVVLPGIGALSGSAERSREVAGTLPGTGALAGDALRVRHAIGTLPGVGAVSAPVLQRFWRPKISISVSDDDFRILTWETLELVFLVIDGRALLQTEAGFHSFHKTYEIRERIDIVDELANTPPTPLDEVDLAWTDEAQDHYQVWQRKDGGSWVQIATTFTTSYKAGPLEDGVYDYRIVSVAANGAEATSNIETETINSAPNPPSNLVASVA